MLFLMDLHPIPRQITTFEFKLIGFMTIKQFGYVLLAGVVGYLFFLAIPIQILNIVVGVVIFSVGLLFAFVPINDRPLDVFIRNLARRLNSPTQYVFRKNNVALRIFDELYFEANPHIVLAHADSREKLSAYLAAKKHKTGDVGGRNDHHAQIGTLLKERQILAPAQSPILVHKKFVVSTLDTPGKKPAVQNKSQNTKHPLFTGVVYNKRHIPLPGVLLYIKDRKTDAVLRILKTNPHGVFATFNPLQDGEYVVEILDSSGSYLFDKTSITINNQTRLNFEFTSKETI
jgi:hypothetical protein